MAPDASAGATEPRSKRADPFAPLTSQHVSVSDGHEIYVETVGRADGIPAVYLHGGPGSGCQVDHRRLFDPERFHAVLFDQRGSGRSRPLASDPDADLSANTTAHLIADIEALRQLCRVDRWTILGLHTRTCLRPDLSQSDQCTGTRVRHNDVAS